MRLIAKSYDYCSQPFPGEHPEIPGLRALGCRRGFPKNCGSIILKTDKFGVLGFPFQGWGCRGSSRFPHVPVPPCGAHPSLAARGWHQAFGIPSHSLSTATTAGAGKLREKTPKFFQPSVVCRWVLLNQRSSFGRAKNGGVGGFERSQCRDHTEHWERKEGRKEGRESNGHPHPFFLSPLLHPCTRSTIPVPRDEGRQDPRPVWMETSPGSALCPPPPAGPPGTVSATIECQRCPRAVPAPRPPTGPGTADARPG